MSDGFGLVFEGFGLVFLVRKIVAQSGLAVLLALGPAGAARADEAAVATPSILSPGYVVTLSAQEMTGPLYPGANRYGYFGSPGIDVHRIGDPERFGTPDDNFGFAVYDTSWFRFGPVGKLLGDRNVNSFYELHGLKTIGTTMEVGGFAEVNPLPFLRGRLEIRQGFGGYRGLVATLGGDIWDNWNSLTLSVGPRFNFGDSRFARAYFSVTPEESAANMAAGGSLTPYDASGGLISGGVAAAARYQWSSAWRSTLFGSFQRLTPSEASSPIVTRDGAMDQFTGGLELAYSFSVTGF